ncbi:sorting nexin-22 isoform X2 [Sminthopsis crassicaudata]|uniref:sorting nexin-22 isoform X2 n=1 Tax=Sminthopsis crassicaudata TaxID=9301 RepID=UPI003D680D55
MLQVHIPSVGPEAAQPERSLERGHMVFRVEVLCNGRRHTIHRRYSEFHALHKQGVLYLNQEVPKEMLEFLKLRHFPSDSKTSSMDTQLPHRPVVNFQRDPYVQSPSLEPIHNMVVNGVLQGFYGYSGCATVTQLKDSYFIPSLLHLGP